MTSSTRGFRIRNYVLDPNQWCALFKVPHEGPPGLWRTVFPASADGETDALSDAYVAEQITGLEPSLGLADVQHRNIYAVNQRVAAGFHAGRVFLAGDSAHVNNPLGGLGMNSGIHDAMNLTEKLIAARDRPQEAEALFAAYTTERRGIARDYVQAQTIQNKKRLEARTPEARKAAMDELRATSDDPARHKGWVMNASLIKGLRELESKPRKEMPMSDAPSAPTRLAIVSRWGWSCRPPTPSCSPKPMRSGSRASPFTSGASRSRTARSPPTTSSTTSRRCAPASRWPPTRSRPRASTA
jgi:hypothetical protein